MRIWLLLQGCAKRGNLLKLGLWAESQVMSQQLQPGADGLAVEPHRPLHPPSVPWWKPINPDGDWDKGQRIMAHTHLMLLSRGIRSPSRAIHAKVITEPWSETFNNPCQKEWKRLINVTSKRAFANSFPSSCPAESELAYAAEPQGSTTTVSWAPNFIVGNSGKIPLLRTGLLHLAESTTLYITENFQVL